MEKKTLAEKTTETCADENRWRQQYGNYRHAYLFGIKKGMSGIRKYYCGWDTYCHMAAGNIRFLLELVDDALTKHVNSDGEVGDPVSFETQTKAAQSAGNKNLRDLEGLALSGARLTKLLLGLGRIFQVMASEPFGHTPEVNQFNLRESTNNEDTQREVDRPSDGRGDALGSCSLSWQQTSGTARRSTVGLRDSPSVLCILRIQPSSQKENQPC